MNFMKQMLHAIRQRLLFQFLGLGCWLLVSLIIALVFGHVTWEWNKALVSIVCGASVAFLSRPRLSQVHKMDNGFYTFRFSELPTHSRIMSGVLLAVGLGSILFVDVVYLYLAGVCGCFLAVLFILQFEKAHGCLLWSRPQHQ